MRRTLCWRDGVDGDEVLDYDDKEHELFCVAEDTSSQRVKHHFYWNLIGSEVWGDHLKHLPVIDLDFECQLIPSRTKGHYHLYLDRALSTEDYRKLLRTMVDVGLVQHGFANQLDDLGMTLARPPKAATATPTTFTVDAPGDPSTRDAIGQYLDSLGCTLWGSHFDISDEDRRTQCIDFIERTMAEVTARKQRDPLTQGV